MDEEYKISFGNLKVLQMIPIMMKDVRYRYELKKLYLNFMVEFGHSKEVKECIKPGVMEE